MKLISIIVPCFNEEESIPLFYAEMCKTTEQMEKKAKFELLFVDDGSSDGTLGLIRSLSVSDPRVRYLSFSRNFGKEAAILAGLEASKGDYVATMDADLQDPPALLPEMFDTLETGEYDCVATRRSTRKGEGKFRSFLARCFYKFINKISKTEIIEGARDFRLMTRRMVGAILSLKEYNRFSKGLFVWVGFRTKWLEYENIERVAGETKWSLRALLRYSLEAILAFSTVPLLLPLLSGIVLGLFGVTVLVLLIVLSAVGHPMAGYWILIDALAFLGSIQLICTGVICSYFSRMYFEIKNRPVYIVREQSPEKREEE